MARRVLANPKIEVLWCTEVKEAHGNEQGNLGERVQEGGGAHARAQQINPNCQGSSRNPRGLLRRAECASAYAGSMSI